MITKLNEKSLEMRSNDVELENIRSGVRAAWRFEDLTSRPSFTGLENLFPDVLYKGSFEENHQSCINQTALRKISAQQKKLVPHNNKVCVQN